jgi:hypothetical protein
LAEIVNSALPLFSSVMASVYWIGFFYFYVRYLKLLHLPTLRFYCVRGFWDRTQDSCDYGIGCQTL